MFGNGSEVSADEDAHAGAGQFLINRRKRVQPCRTGFGSQNRLVDLNPIRTFGCQFAQQLRVSRQQFGQQQVFHAAVDAVFLFTQPSQGNGADQGRLDVVALRFGFFDLRDQVFGVYFEFGVGRPFGHDEVVVGVEPFGHFHCKLGGVAACQLEVFGQAQVGRVETEAFRNAAQSAQQIKHMVVEREIAHRQQIRTCGFLRRPVQTADFGGYGLQLGFGFRAFPKGFDGKFQLALRTDARIA